MYFRLRAHLWEPFWSAFDPAEVKAFKTKAHCTSMDVERGLTTAWERKANAGADKFAKKGARVNCVPDVEVLLYKGLKLVAKEAASWAGQLHAHMEAVEVRDAIGLPTAKDVEMAIPEEGNDSGGAVVVEADAFNSVAHELPSAVEQRGRSLRANGHSIVQAAIIPESAGSVLFCTNCGAYSWKRVRQFKSTCRGPAAEGMEAQRARLKSGRFPGQTKDWRIGAAQGPDESEQMRVCKSLGQSVAKSGGWREVRVSQVSQGQWSRAQLLSHFGIPPGGEAEFLHWCKDFFDNQDGDDVI